MNDSTVVGDAKILATDISSGNGVIHAIDTVLITWLLASLDPITKWSDYLVNVLVAIFVINNFNFLKMTINVVKNFAFLGKNSTMVAPLVTCIRDHSPPAEQSL